MKRLRVCLVKVGTLGINNRWVVPPVGLLSLAAYTREKLPVDFLLIDQVLEGCSPNNIADRVNHFGCDVLGLSLTSLSAYNANRIIRAVRAICPNIITVLGGPHISAVKWNVLESIEADVAIAGEGERPFVQFLHEYFDGGSLQNVPGLIWRADTETIITNPGSIPLIEDLDSLPRLAYDLIELPQYWNKRSIVPGYYRRRYASLMTSRGCPYRCIFCHNIFGKHYRMQSPERIVDDVAWLRQRYNIDDFEFNDDAFNYDPARVIQFCNLLKSRNMKIRFAVPNGIRGDLLTQEVVDAMADAGLYNVLIALESGSHRIQKLIRKNLQINRFLKACEMLDKRRVFTHATCIMGFPTETEEELQQSIDVACAARSHTTIFFLATPFYGTHLYDMVKESHPEKLKQIEFDNQYCASVHVNLTDLPDEVLFHYQRKAFRKYYFNPWRITRLLQVHGQVWALPASIGIVLAGAIPCRFHHAA